MLLPLRWGGGAGGSPGSPCRGRPCRSEQRRVEARPPPPPPILWPFVLSHVCEYAQVCNDPDIGEERIAQVLAEDPRKYAGDVARRMAALRDEQRALPHKCHTGNVVLAAWAAATRHGGRKRILRKGAPAPEPKRRRRQEGLKSRCLRCARMVPAAMLVEHRKRCHQPGGLKEVIACPLCEARVRKDVISRHQKSHACMEASGRLPGARSRSGAGHRKATGALSAGGRPINRGRGGTGS